MKKLLLSMRVTEANNYSEKRNSIAYDYIDFFEKLGFLVILIPNNTKNIKNYFKNIDFVVLTGGNNINPLLYNNKDTLDDIYNERDTLENEIISYSLLYDIPILGICRGFQLLNIYFGASITNNIKNHVNKTHILVSKNNILNGKICNSYHNQAIKTNDLSECLNIIASTNNIVEAFIHKEKRILAIQWHPERQNKEYDKKLIIDFIEGKL